ncbi:MAG: hypothetical protein CFE45_42025 [Burkholderiales bacterium PBB5]|nr:MAG: hypothetical protein CFE45_42025 [Burkholderiales bacterium PBB5]
MTTIDADFLYQRLPAVYRLRDAQHGEPLKALLAVVAAQASRVEADIDRLYRNWFIETCDDWVVPYLGDLLGVRGLHAVAGTPAFSPRALVADTLRLRRRKGTALALEQLTRDCTGWPAHAVEAFALLATTNHVNHVRLDNHRTPDLRDSARLQRLDGAFDDIAHTATVRHLPARRHNIPQVALFVWRLQAYPLRQATARAVAGAAAGLYTLDPLGRDLPLFNRAHSETDISQLAQEIHVPAPLRRRPLFDELEARRAALAAGLPVAAPQYFDDRSDAVSPPVLSVALDGVAVPPEQLHICHLDDIAGVLPRDWRRPASAATAQVAIDPERGRLALAANVAASRVEVGFAYGLAGDVGGGPYDRRGRSAQDPAALVAASSWPGAQHWQVPASSSDRAPSAQAFATLGDALSALQVLPKDSRVLLEILDDASYPAGLVLTIPGIELTLQAANGHRPVLLGDLTVQGDLGTRLTLGGLAIDGAVKLQGPLAVVSLHHCTMHPARGGLRCQGLGAVARISLRRCLCGLLSVGDALEQLLLSECLIDGQGALRAIDTPRVALTVDRCTVLGATRAQTLSASDSLFTGTVRISRRQQGCVRFCYLPPDSLTPRRHRCQPALATAELLPSRVAAAQARLVPVFTSDRFEHPAYGQLAATCADELVRGADNGAEMGVWNFLQQAQREANLQHALGEYLRFGMQAALIPVT